MTARIYQPAKTAMQSGKARTGHWVVEHEASTPRSIEPLMGYTSSSDMMSQVSLKFDSREDAIDYAERNGLDYRISEPKAAKRAAVSYGENFRHDRKVPWSH